MAASSASPRISDAREPNGYDCPYPRASPASPRDSDRRHTNWKRLPGSAGRAAACISLPQPEDSVVNAIDSMARKGMRSWRRHRSWRHQGKGRNRLPARRIGDLVEPSNRRTVEPSNRRAVEPSSRDSPRKPATPRRGDSACITHSADGVMSLSRSSEPMEESRCRLATRTPPGQADCPDLPLFSITASPSEVAPQSANAPGAGSL